MNDKRKNTLCQPNKNFHVRIHDDEVINALVVYVFNIGKLSL